MPLGGVQPSRCHPVHGVARITDGGQNAIVRFDPKTEAVKTWPLHADGGYANLNTGAFNKNGVYWFTGQNGIYGRLDPGTGRMQVFKAPQGRGPYGITATPDGDVYYVSLAGSYLAKIDRDTGEARVIEPPTPNQGARRVWSDSQGRLWISEWNSGQVSMHDPQTGAGRRGVCRATVPTPTRSMWTSATRCGCPISEGTPCTRSIRNRHLYDVPDVTEKRGCPSDLGRRGEVWLPESGADRLVVIRTDTTQ